jgi:hypothetical protein
MLRSSIILATAVLLFSACRSTRKIQTVVAPKDTTVVTNIPKVNTRADSLRFISDVYSAMRKHHIDFTTFSAKIDVDYDDEDKGKNNVNAHVRMRKDSVIWISITGIFGAEGLRAYITPDSVKILDKREKLYIARSVEYLQDVTALPLDLPALQQLLVGNPVFLDSNIVSYSQTDDAISLLHIGEFFKHLFTINKTDKLPVSSKLDDLDELRNRTCYVTYSDYESKKGPQFATKRRITVTEKKKVDIKLDFKQYEFNETLSFPFSVPKNYKSN